MSPRILIAGIGNIFLGDDAFGVEVIRELFKRPPHAGVKIVDFGIRSFDLAYALLDPWEVVIFVDAVPRGEAPGTLYTIEPDLAGLEQAGSAGVAVDAHSMDPVKVLKLAASMGEIPKNIYIVGCEPGDCGGDEGRMGLTAPVEAAIPRAVLMIEDLLRNIFGSTNKALTETALTR